MCQIAGVDAQWISIGGLIMNIVGVSVVALEWRTAMYDGLSRIELEQGLLALDTDRPTTKNLEISPAAKRLIDRVDLEHIASDDARYDAFMKNVLILDTADRLSRRRTIFTLGFLFILAGSVGQLIGAWPC